MKRVFFLLFFLLVQQLSATENYLIASINQNTITLSNGSIFNVSPVNQFTLKNWQVNDSVNLISINVGFVSAPPIHTDSNQFVFSPILLLNNSSQNDEQVTAWMQIVPPYSNGMDTPEISNIDFVNRLIELSDMTTWAYAPSYQSAVEFWNIGDVIMKGINGYYSHTPNYPDILLNTNQQMIINVIAQ